MPYLDVIYANDSLSPDIPIQADAVLDRLGRVLGGAAGNGWALASAVPIPGAEGSWRVRLQHDDDTAILRAREAIAATADSTLRLWQDEATPAQPAHSTGTDTPWLPLPRRIPAILTQAESTQRRHATIVGIAIGIVLSVGLGLLAPAKSVIRQMFNPLDPSAAVPTAILCLFFWGIMIAVTQIRRLRALTVMNATNLLPAVIDGLQTHGLKGLNQALQHDAVGYSPLLRRIRITVEQWLIRPSLQNASLAIEQQVISDQGTTQRNYSMLRMFVWATPVLGLIGTVIGISIAVGGFAGFLSTDVEDISKIKEGLVGVTGGLSFAFLITLQGLLSSLILMLLTSAVQDREERLYAKIEQDIAEDFLPALQRIAPERDPNPVTQGPIDWSDGMIDATHRIMAAIDVAGKKLLSTWDAKHTAYLSDITSAEARIEATASSVGAALNAATLETATHLKSLVEALDDATARHRELTDHAFTGSRQTLRDFDGGLVQASEAVAGLAAVTQQVLASQAALHEAMAYLGDARLANLFQDLDGSLKDLKPVISNLSRPFVLQAVPVTPDGT